MKNKLLVIARHGEAGWESGVSDFDRELTMKGRGEAKRIGENLVPFGVFDQLIHSSSIRTTQTAGIISSTLDQKNIELISKPELYNCDLVCWKKELAGFSDSTNSIIIVGHNPALSELVAELTSALFFGLGTGGVAIIEFNCSKWKDISKLNSTLKFSGKFEF